MLDCLPADALRQRGEGAARPTADSRGSRPCDSIIGTAHSLPNSHIRVTPRKPDTLSKPAQIDLA